MNPLDQYPQIRQHLYLVQWVVNLVLGVIGIVLTSFGQSPVWFVITSAAFNFVWTYAGITAQGNVTEPGKHRADPPPMPDVKFFNGDHYFAQRADGSATCSCGFQGDMNEHARDVLPEATT